MLVFKNIRKTKEFKLVTILLCILVLFGGMQKIGVVNSISGEVAKFGKALAGYESRVYMVSDKGRTPIAIMGGTTIKQEICLNEKILKNDTFLLEISVANYERINTGQLVLEVYQDDVYKVYVTDMAQIQKDKKIRVIIDSEDFKKGNIQVVIYAPESSGENCVAVYAVNNKETYSGLIVDGQDTEMNACINLLIPSQYAKSDFVLITE